MQFINIVVHSVENMNFRVHLQYEFSQHGLDDYLEASVTFDLVVCHINTFKFSLDSWIHSLWKKGSNLCVFEAGLFSL